MARYKPLRSRRSTSQGLRMSKILRKFQIRLFLSEIINPAITKYLSANSKIVIEVISRRDVNYTAEVCECLTESPFSLAKLTFLSPGELLISVRYWIYFWRGKWNKCGNFHLVCISPWLHMVSPNTYVAEGGLTSPISMSGLPEVWSDLGETVLPSGRYRQCLSEE